MKNNDEQDAQNPNSLRPYWIPEDVALEDLPPGCRSALESIVGPAYEDLVAGAASPLERLAAISAVHLAHVEVIDQLDLARELERLPPADRDKRIAGHVRLVGTKIRVMAFLERLRQARGVPLPATRRRRRRPK